MLNKIKSVVTSKPFLYGLAAGVLVALAFKRFIPSFVKQAANAIPGSDAKTA